MSDIQRKRFEKRVNKARGPDRSGVDYRGPAGSACETCLASGSWKGLSGYCSMRKQTVMRFQNCSDYTSRRR